MRPDEVLARGSSRSLPVRANVTSVTIDVRQLGTRALLSTYSQILTELVERGVIRTRNAPAGDLAEYLVAQAYGGELAPNSEKSWDVRCPGGTLLQVKCRLVTEDDIRSQVYSVFRSWEFTSCVFVLLDRDSYAVVSAAEVPMESARMAARHSSHVNGDRIPVRTDLLALPGAVDVTGRLQYVVDRLEGGSGA